MTIMLSADWRVRPLDHLQLVLERRSKAPTSQLERCGEAWKAQAYLCRTRDGLYCALSRFNSEADATQLAVLPERFIEQ